MQWRDTQVIRTADWLKPVELELDATSLNKGLLQELLGFDPWEPDALPVPGRGEREAGVVPADVARLPGPRRAPTGEPDRERTLDETEHET